MHRRIGDRDAASTEALGKPILDQVRKMQIELISASPKGCQIRVQSGHNTVITDADQEGATLVVGESRNSLQDWSSRRL